MKNLLNLGTVLNKAEQKNVFGGFNGLQGPGEPCHSNEDCWNTTGNFNSRCNARTGRCYV